MKKLSLVSLALAAACTAQTPSSQTERFQSGPDAQHVGVYAYTVENDIVTLFDRYGMELGVVTVTEPSSQGRHFELAAVDGTADEVDVNRPFKDGRFFAPITPETMLTAALGDSALAEHWAAHKVAFSINLAPRLAAEGLVPSDTATTTACSSYACGQSCTPYGCAKPANTSVGCTNPSALPATSVDNRFFKTLSPNYNQTYCQNPASQANECMTALGGDTTSDWISGSTGCMQNLSGFWKIMCLTGTSTNEWVASCPRQTCGTAGYYDAVPRDGSCNNPGSCSYSQGTVGCTPYH